MIAEVDLFIENAKQWKEEFVALRHIVLDCGLKEHLKWKQPCYSFEGSNVLILGGFKAFCTISFFKGVLLKDEKGLLNKPGPNTNAGRIIKFQSVEEIVELEPTIKSYIKEAIEVEKSGVKVEVQKKEQELPNELMEKFEEVPSLKKAFLSLTPGRQRGYLIHINGTKNSKTKTARIEKHMDRILDGYGIHDCICGHSKRMPTCDGSHKYI